MKWFLALVFVSIALRPSLAGSSEEQVNYFPSVMYGHILAGTAASRYETTLIIRSRTNTRAHIEIFSDQSAPMQASFADEEGHIAATTNSFTFVLEPDRLLQVRLQLPAEEAANDIAVKTGWATVSSFEELEVSALVRITTPEGKILTRQILPAERTTRS